MAMVWLVLRWLVWLRLAGRSGRPRVRDGSVMLIFGGWVPQGLGSSHVRCLKSSAAARGRVLRRLIADWCARAGGGSGRLASRNGCGESVSVSW
jgi:hypothetical protein